MNKLFPLTATLLAVFLTACSNQQDYWEEETVPPIEQETYTISFGMGGFDAEVSTRTTDAKTIYGINVYFDKERDGVQDDNYAYGLFDSTAPMSIALIGGYKYRFACSIVRDANEHLYYGPYATNGFSGYAKPFQLNTAESTMLQNAFVYGTDYLCGLDKGMAVVTSDTEQAGYVTSSNYPSLERYYGEYADYSPKANDKIIIPVKKTFFGNKLIVRGLPDSSEGWGEVFCYIGSQGSNIVWSVSNLTSEYDGEGIIYSYSDLADCWKNDSELSAIVAYNYFSNRGEWWNMSGSKVVKFKRNVMTTITVNISPDLSNGAISINEEPLDDDNVITIQADNGELEIVTVSPNEE